jgi:FkbM family methyltransferase
MRGMSHIGELIVHGDRTTLENYCRRATQPLVLSDDLALGRVLGKFLMYVDPVDESLTPHLLLDGYWEMWITMAIAKHVKPGMRVVDVGAHFGYYTLLLSDIVGATGGVIAFEPTDHTRQYLGRNVLHNDLHNVYVRTEAVSDASRESTMGITRHDSGTNWLGADSKRRYDSGRNRSAYLKSQPVTVVTLDAALVPPIDFIKIDVEGHEGAVWDGMQDVIAKSPNLQIAMEYTELSDKEGRLAQAMSRTFNVHEVLPTGDLSQRLSVSQIVAQSVEGWRMLWLRRA